VIGSRPCSVLVAVGTDVSLDSARDGLCRSEIRRVRWAHRVEKPNELDEWKTPALTPDPSPNYGREEKCGASPTHRCHFDRSATRSNVLIQNRRERSVSRGVEKSRKLKRSLDWTRDDIRVLATRDLSAAFTRWRSLTSVEVTSARRKKTHQHLPDLEQE
jgi:hypothetical protein